MKIIIIGNTLIVRLKEISLEISFLIWYNIYIEQIIKKRGAGLNYTLNESCVLAGTGKRIYLKKIVLYDIIII